MASNSYLYFYGSVFGLAIPLPIKIRLREHTLSQMIRVCVKPDLAIQQSSVLYHFSDNASIAGFLRLKASPSDNKFQIICKR